MPVSPIAGFLKGPCRALVGVDPIVVVFFRDGEIRPTAIAENIAFLRTQQLERLFARTCDRNREDTQIRSTTGSTDDGFQNEGMRLSIRFDRYASFPVSRGEFLDTRYNQIR